MSAAQRDLFKNSANPSSTYGALNLEVAEFIRFMKTSDLRVATRRAAIATPHRRRCPSIDHGDEPDGVPRRAVTTTATSLEDPDAR